MRLETGEKIKTQCEKKKKTDGERDRERKEIARERGAIWQKEGIKISESDKRRGGRC